MVCSGDPFVFRPDVQRLFCIDIMETRHEIQESIESHGGKVIEKMPSAVRRRSSSIFRWIDATLSVSSDLESTRSGLFGVGYCS